MVAAPSRRAVRASALPMLALLACGCAPADEGAPPTPPAAGRPPQQQQQHKPQIERGRSLLAQYQCGSCHAIPEVPAARGRTGPTLAAFGRRSYIAGQVPNRPEQLARWIVAPAELVPGTTMPAMGVSPADARDMAAYLLSLE